MNQFLMDHLKVIETFPLHNVRAKRIREAVERYLETKDERFLLRLEYYERDIALEILDDEAPVFNWK